MLRQVVRKLSRGVVLKRRLPAEFGRAPMFVSPEATLGYWQRDLGREGTEEHGHLMPSQDSKFEQRTLNQGVGCLDFSDRAWVLHHQRIDREQDDTFDRRLRNQNAIEWVLMDRWQAVDGDHVTTRNRQFVVAVVQEAATQQPRIGPEVAAAKLRLGDDLPQASGAEEQFVGWIIDKALGCTG